VPDPQGTGVTRPIGDRLRCGLTAITIVAVAGGTLGVPTSAVADPEVAPPPAGPPADAPTGAEDDEEPPVPTPEELAHERAVEALAAALRDRRAADAALRAATVATAGADGALRAGEEAIVAGLLDRLQADEGVVRAQRHLRAAERTVARLEQRTVLLERRAEELDRELAVARRQLEDRVVRAYKTGSLGYETSLPLVLVREATSPSELATAVKHLRTLMGVGLDHVEGLLAETVGLEQRRAQVRDELLEARDQLAGARADLAAAEADRDAAAGDVERRETRAAQLRADAYASEGRLIAAAASVRRAQSALDDARAEARRTAERAEVLPPPEAAEPPEGEDVVTAWDRRESALGRARSLAPGDRRAADDWRCPVEGGRFVNDWGFPRSNNRRHEGTDVFAATGTPVLAPVDAVVAELDHVDRFDGRRDLGGISVTLERDRHRYYLAHLDRIHPSLREGDTVEAGAVVGWVGRTGNARGTPPHLHLGWYVDRVAVNPYATLAVACSTERPRHRGPGVEADEPGARRPS
jgi:murein DD-endopeptidase MepM/ murein hydrolase activator NlpD